MLELKINVFPEKYKDKVAAMIHNSLVGYEEYINNNILLNKDDNITLIVGPDSDNNTSVKLKLLNCDSSYIHKEDLEDDDHKYSNEGCEYCCCTIEYGRKDILLDTIDFGVFGKHDVCTYISNSGQLTTEIISNNGPDGPILWEHTKIKFCPMCGRKIHLKE